MNYDKHAVDGLKIILACIAMAILIGAMLAHISYVMG